MGVTTHELSVCQDINYNIDNICQQRQLMVTFRLIAEGVLKSINSRPGGVGIWMVFIPGYNTPVPDITDRKGICIQVGI
jgi:hypothetical protein